MTTTTSTAEQLDAEAYQLGVASALLHPSPNPAGDIAYLDERIAANRIAAPYLQGIRDTYKVKRDATAARVATVRRGFAGYDEAEVTA